MPGINHHEFVHRVLLVACIIDSGMSFSNDSLCRDGPNIQYYFVTITVLSPRSVSISLLAH